jgi:RNA 3'-terminal phosphate cyclase (ATP)
MQKQVEIDGSFGEGGGQVLRSSLTMSLFTGKPMHIINIRAGRRKPGLRHQHMTSVTAAAQIGSATVTGNELGSQELTFMPGAVHPGDYHFTMSTAGSCTLVLQTILPVLLISSGPSRIVLEGGTHNPYAPPFEFLDRAFIPLIKRMGAEVSLTLDHHGFFPAGGGKVRVFIKPAKSLHAINLSERGEIKRISARAIVSALPTEIGTRELRVLKKKLHLKPEHMRVEEIRNPRGPGNSLIVTIESEEVTEVFSCAGQKGLRAEEVARRLSAETMEYLDANVPVGKRLADQLLVPMALAGAGKYATLPPTDHTVTSLEVIRTFLDIDIGGVKRSDSLWEIGVGV